MDKQEKHLSKAFLMRKKVEEIFMRHGLEVEYKEPDKKNFTVSFKRQKDKPLM